MDPLGDEELIVIVDASLRGWKDVDSSATAPRHLKFEAVKESILGFLQAACAVSRGAPPAVLAFNDEFGGWLSTGSDAGTGAPARSSVGCAAQLRRQADLGLSLLRHQAAIDARLGSGSVGDPGGALHVLGLGPRLCSMAACLCAAVCYANRRKATVPRLRCRILALQAGSDVAADYIAIVNATYSCLRLDVPVDSVDLSPPLPRSAGGGGAAPAQALALQQASLVSCGRHCTPTPCQRAALLEFLITVCLPDAALRSSVLLLPPPEGADLRAHCFCHAQKQSVGWVCPVCLAIWCRFSERCATCGTESGTAAASGGGSSGGGQ